MKTGPYPSSGTCQRLLGSATMNEPTQTREVEIMDSEVRVVHPQLWTTGSLRKIAVLRLMFVSVFLHFHSTLVGDRFAAQVLVFDAKANKALTVKPAKCGL